MTWRSTGRRRTQNRLLSAPDEVNDLVRQIVQTEVAHGLDARSECLGVVRAASRFAGWSYRITREFRQGLIDCSTLVSQSHWEGAAVGTPFVAETQRTAYNAADVPEGRWLPGDVLVRYRPHELSPLRRHNHVALFAGRDPHGAAWMIESREPFGVRAVLVDDAAADGGARRFLPHPTRVFDDELALALARAVPKLGRLGCRLTAALGDSQRHRGIDVCFSRSVEVFAPLDGVVAFTSSGRGSGSSTAIIMSARRADVVVLRPLNPAVGQQARVAREDVIGELDLESNGGCNAIPALRGFARLHIEYWSRRHLSFHPDRDLGPSFSSSRAAVGYAAYNPLYALKVGLLGSPIAAADVATAALALPLGSLATS
jgi:hypothetical protein